VVDTIRAEQAVGSSAPSPPRSRRRRRELLPYLLLLPAIVLELLIHVVPMLAGVGISFLQLTQFYLSNWRAAPFAGTANYAVALNLNGATGQALLHSFTVTVTYTVLVLAISWTFGLVAAVLTQRSFRGRGLVRTVFLIPFALPVFASSRVTWTTRPRSTAAGRWGPSSGSSSRPPCRASSPS
jgi:multiple sugar transport system permease protein